MKAVGIKASGNLLIVESSEPTEGFAAKVEKEIEKSGECNLEITKTKRSLSANAYMWSLCSAVGRKLKKSKEEVYIRAVKDVGVFELVPVKESAVPDFIAHWQSGGLGWLAERQRDSTLNGYAVVAVYFGSSSYDSKEMSTLIDYLVADAEELGIPTLRQEEIDSLINEWKGSRKNGSNS